MSEELEALKASIAADAKPAAQPDANATTDTTAPTDADKQVEQAETAPAAGEAATPDEPGDDQADETQPKKKGGFQNRIDKLTRERYEAEERARIAEAKVAEVTKPAEVKDPGDMPKLEDHASLEAYNQALQKWRDDSVAYARQQAEKDVESKLESKRAEEEVIAARAAIKAKEDAVRAKHPDYDSVLPAIGPAYAQTPLLQSYVKESEAGAEVMYHLGKNPALLQQIVETAKTSPIAAGRELFKLEQRLAAPPKKISNAPEPVKTVGAQESIKVNLAALATKDDPTDYVRKRRQQMLAKK